MNNPQPARTPYCHKIRYGITDAPILTEDEMDGSYAPGVGVSPTLIELVYSAARDGKPAAVSASVTGDWTRFGEPDGFGGQVTTHFKNGPDGWPVWLAAEARLHDPERAGLVAVPPTTAEWDAPPCIYRVSEIRDNVLRRIHGYHASLDSAFAYCEEQERTPTTIPTARCELFPAPGGDTWLVHLYAGLAEGDWPETSDLVISRHEVASDGPADAVLGVPSAGSGDTAATRAVLNEARVIARRLAAHAAGFQDVLDDSDRDPWAKTVGADITALRAALDGEPAAVQTDEEATP